MKTLYFILTLAIITFTSCEQMISDVEIPENITKQKLVIISYVSPEDSIIKVKLYQSVAYFNNSGINTEDFLVTDGTIILSDGTNTKQFYYDNTTRQYSCTDNSFKVQGGVEYTIDVSTPDGKTNSAKCNVISYKVGDFSIEIFDSIVDGEYSYGQTEYILDITIPDIPNQKNYYRLLAYNSEDTTNFYPSLDEFVTDEHLDGQNIKIRVHTYQMDTTKVLDVYLLTCDQAYYEYHQSVWYNNGESPFTEPSPIYSNTENGMGVFCSYRWIKKTLMLK